jgi:hypothetical protein
VNVLSAQRVNRAALPVLRKQGKGLVIWVGSSSTRGGTPPYHLQAPDGTMWQSDQLLLRNAGKMGQKFSLEAAVDSPFYRKVKDEPLKVRGSLYMTLFGNRETVRVSFGDRSVLVSRVGVCSASGGAHRQSHFLICSSAFRFPPVLVSYSFTQSAKEAVQDVWTSTDPVDRSLILRSRQNPASAR